MNPWQAVTTTHSIFIFSVDHSSHILDKFVFFIWVSVCPRSSNFLLKVDVVLKVFLPPSVALHQTSARYYNKNVRHFDCLQKCPSFWLFTSYELPGTCMLRQCSNFLIFKEPFPCFTYHALSAIFLHSFLFESCVICMVVWFWLTSILKVNYLFITGEWRTSF